MKQQTMIKMTVMTMKRTTMMTMKRTAIRTMMTMTLTTAMMMTTKKTTMRTTTTLSNWEKKKGRRVEYMRVTVIYLHFGNTEQPIKTIIIISFFFHSRRKVVCV